MDDYLGLNEIIDNNTKIDDIETEDVNLIFIGIDSSGSMYAYVDIMKDELKKFKRSIENTKEASQILVSRINFNHVIKGTGYRKINDFDIVYDSNGNTKLYDCICQGSDDLIKYLDYLKSQGARVKAVFSIFSDGYDTVSINNLKKAKDKIEKLNRLEIVTAFISFGNEALNEANALCFKNILEVGKSDSELRKAFNCLSKSIISNSQSIINNTNNFFVV
jgi:hypothetical protein